MFKQAEHPDGWHNVTAPGGYEWWYFDAESADGRTQIVGIFLEGFVFHPGYLRQYARFRRRPTKVVPPVAGDFPCVYLVVYRDGKILHQFMTQYRPDQFSARSDRPNVTIGPNSLRQRDDDVYELKLSGTPWKLTGRGPQLLESQTLSAELTFTPTFSHTPVEGPFFSREMSGADHRWVLAAPRCAVSGSIQCEGIETFTGVGYHDHNYGTATIGPGLKGWMWGRMLTDDGVVAFHYARACRADLADEIHVFSSDSAGTRELLIDDWRPPRWDRRSSLFLPYPNEIAFSTALRLSAPQIIDSAPFYLRLMMTGEFNGRPGTAFCEIAYPHRLRWPVLGRMIEMSIDKRPLRQSAG